MHFCRVIQSFVVCAGFVMGVLSLGLVDGLASETNAPPGILFLQVKLHSDQTVTLVKSTPALGTLKSFAPSTTGLRYELQDAGGQLLWTATIDDPRERLAEPSKSGGGPGLKSVKVEKTEVEFMVRVPLLSNATQLVFYQLTNATPNEVVAKKLNPLPLPKQ